MTHQKVFILISRAVDVSSCQDLPPFLAYLLIRQFWGLA